MASLWSAKAPPEAPAPPKEPTDVADTGIPDAGLLTSEPLSSVQMGREKPVRLQGRPPLGPPESRRPPPHQPPPPPAPQTPQQMGNPNDSLSLMQLRRIVTEFPKIDPVSYAFTYSDTATFEEEVDEWFSYNEAEYKRLLRAKDTFRRRWKKYAGRPWLESEQQQREKFVEKEVHGLHATDLRRRCKSLQTILHIILGTWDETAGKHSSAEEKIPNPKTKATPFQLEHMKAAVALVAQAGGIPLLFEVMENAFKRLWDDDFRETQLLEEDIPFIQDELDNVTTILYLIIEGVRNDPNSLQSVRAQLMDLNPGMVDYFVGLTARLRWDEANDLPQTRIFLLFWKSVLLAFGGLPKVDEVKAATSELRHLDSEGIKIITASPLDYHIFRQEITSKYPAYIPPQPLLPLEPENNSILPPLPNRPSRSNGANGILPPPMNTHSSSTSILHQPVHIATPAPSPPPSPPVGGKAGKKQNYQTNQNFPFMYPPLDSTSNSAGGKGQAGLQGQLVGRKWEGSDIPKSIIEAGKLFSDRMRMTRAMRQLWDERENFLKFERGWDGDDDDIDEFELGTALAARLSLDRPKHLKPEADYGPHLDVSPEVKNTLGLIEEFYVRVIANSLSIC